MVEQCNIESQRLITFICYMPVGLAIKDSIRKCETAKSSKRKGMQAATLSADSIAVLPRDDADMTLVLPTNPVANALLFPALCRLRKGRGTHSSRTGRENTEWWATRRDKKLTLIRLHNPTWEDLAEGWGEPASMQFKGKAGSSRWSE
jgi:hypothetical protein